LCEHCGEAYEPNPEDLPADFPLEQWKEEGRPIYQPVGCRACRGTGYQGRVGLYELLVANEEIRHLANERTNSYDVKRAAISAGMRTLRQDGWRKVLWGRTGIDEVLRVTKSD
jgi:general secretion pathway protein E/type IV pilus assembly protein PilB